MKRWVFTDPVTSAVYTVPRNPREMTSPYPPRNTQVMANAIDGRARVVRTFTVPMEWEFVGDIRSEAHYGALLAWSAKDYRVRITDHFNRTWEVLLTQFDPTEEKPSTHLSWKFNYRMRGLVYRRIS